MFLSKSSFLSPSYSQVIFPWLLLSKSSNFPSFVFLFYSPPPSPVYPRVLHFKILKATLVFLPSNQTLILLLALIQIHSISQVKATQPFFKSFPNLSLQPHLLSLLTCSQSPHSGWPVAFIPLYIAFSFLEIVLNLQISAQVSHTS